MVKAIKSPPLFCLGAAILKKGKGRLMGKRIVTIGLLCAGILVLISEAFRIIYYDWNLSKPVLDKFVEFEEFFLALFLETIIIKIAIFGHVLLALLKKDQELPLLRQAFLLFFAFFIIGGVICFIGEINVFEYLIIISSDLICFALLFRIISISYFPQLNDSAHFAIKFFCFLFLILTPILRVFVNGRLVFIYMFKPVFLLGISSGLLFLAAALLLYEPRGEDVWTPSVFFTIIGFIQLILVALLCLGAYFEQAFFYREQFFIILMLFFLQPLFIRWPLVWKLLGAFILLGSFIFFSVLLLFCYNQLNFLVFPLVGALLSLLGVGGNLFLFRSKFSTGLF